MLGAFHPDAASLYSHISNLKTVLERLMYLQPHTVISEC